MPSLTTGEVPLVHVEEYPHYPVVYCMVKLVHGMMEATVALEDMEVMIPVVGVIPENGSTSNGPGKRKKYLE